MLLLAALVLGGCGAKSRVEGTPEEAAQQITDKVCEAARTCCEGTEFDTEALSECEDLARARIDATFGFSADVTGVDEAALGRCLARYEQLADSCTLDRRDALDNPCGAAFQGTAPAGAPCDSVAACARSESNPVSCYRGPEQTTAGVCTPMTRGSLGDRCAFTVPEHFTGSDVGSSGGLPSFGACSVAEGLYCNLRTHACAPLVAPGEECLASEDCQPGYACEEFVCAAERREGQPCDPGRCASDLVCVQNICTTRPYASEPMCSGLY